MAFAYDTEMALVSAAALINTGKESPDGLTTVADLDRFLDQQGFSGARTGTPDELAAVLTLRAELEEVWSSSEDDAVVRVNRMLSDAGALPRLVRHDHWDWHLHATGPGAPLADRMATEAAMALIDVIRTHEMDRLRICTAAECSAVVLDLSRNRSKQYCDTGNCANRTHVKAYRARKAASR